MSKEAIINKILSDADQKADAILSEAQAKAGESIAQANAAGRDSKRVAEAEASLKAPEMKRRALSAAELEVKKWQRMEPTGAVRESEPEGSRKR